MATTFGYARCFIDGADITAQKSHLAARGVPEEHAYIDEGYTSTRRERQGLSEVLDAVRKGDTLVVPTLDRLARSIADLGDILDQLSSRQVRLSWDGKDLDWEEASGNNFLADFALIREFDAALRAQRTREGMAIAKSNGKVLRGRQPKLSPKQQKRLIRMSKEGCHNVTELADHFGISRATVHRVLARGREKVKHSEPSGVASYGPPRPYAKTSEPVDVLNNTDDTANASETTSEGAPDYKDGIRDLVNHLKSTGYGLNPFLGNPAYGDDSDGPRDYDIGYFGYDYGLEIKDGMSGHTRRGWEDRRGGRSWAPLGK